MIAELRTQKRARASPGRRHIRAILFDADNTIFRTRKAAKKADFAAMQALSRQTHTPSSELYMEWRAMVRKLKTSPDPKKRLRKYSYQLVAKKHGASGITPAYRAFLKELTNHIELEPSFKIFLKAIPKSPSPLRFALITEAPRDLTLLKLRKFGLTKRFSAIITSEDIGKMKPHQKYYLLALRKLGVKPDECMAVGDSFEKDLLIPKKLGCATALFGKKDKLADYSIKDYTQLLRILARP